MNYVIETDIFKEVATFPNIENQTPNKEINHTSVQIPLASQIACHTFGIAPMPNQTSHSQIYWCRESTRFQFQSATVLFQSRSEVNIDKYCFAHGHYPLAPLSLFSICKVFLQHFTAIHSCLCLACETASLLIDA